jgi:hypothetical protein
MKNKPNPNLTPRESRLAEEAVGIKRDKTGKFAKIANYKEDFENQQTATRVCTQKLERASRTIQKQIDDLIFYKYFLLFFLVIIAIAIVDALAGEYIDIANDTIINFLVPFYEN